jgi:hypothetical protein
MTEDEIRAEFDRLSDGYDLVVPRHIALAVAKLVADIADRRAREECAGICDVHAFEEYPDGGYRSSRRCSELIRDTIKPD